MLLWRGKERKKVRMGYYLHLIALPLACYASCLGQILSVHILNFFKSATPLWQLFLLVLARTMADYIIIVQCVVCNNWGLPIMKI